MELKPDYLWLQYKQEPGTDEDSKKVLEGAKMDLDLIHNNEIMGSITVALTEAEFAVVLELFDRVKTRALNELKAVL